MRRSLSILAAAAFSVVGVAMSFAPAQAGVRAPAVLDEASKSGIVQVHKRHRGHRHRRGRVVYVVPQYVPVYPAYRSYGYYGHGGPGISLNFNLGGGRHGYRDRGYYHGGGYGGGHHRW